MKHTVVGELQARFMAWRYGNPARGVKIIAVAGSQGKSTVALMLDEILRESGASVMTLTNLGSYQNGSSIPDGYDASAEALQQRLQKAKKDGVFFVIVEVTNELLNSFVLSTLPIEMTIITGDSASARTLLGLPANASVIPTGFDISELRVAPHQVISYGFEDESEAQITRVVERRKGTELEMVIDHQTRIELATYLVGQLNAQNLAAAVSAAYVLAIDTASFQEGAARLERVAGNYDYLPTGDAVYEAVVDRAPSEASLEQVLLTAKKLKKRRLLVIADGSVSSEQYPLIARSAERAIAIGDAPAVPGIDKAESLQAAMDITIRGAKKDDLLLLLGNEFGTLQPSGLTRAHNMIGEKHDDE